MSRAAEHLSSSQPSVSQQVSSLERELAVTLFERSGARISITPLGRRLLRLALPVVIAMDRLPDTFADRYRESHTGELLVAAGQSTAAFVLPRYLERFRKRYPDARVRVRCGGGSKRVEWLRAYEVDVVFGAMDIPPPDLVFRRVLSCGHVLITPEDHPLAGRNTIDMRDLAPYPTIMPRAGSRTRRMIDTWTRLHGFVPEVAAEVDGWSTVKRYVEAGVGISMVPDICITGQDRIASISMDHVLPRIGYGLLARPDHASLSSAARYFIRLLAPDFPERA